MLCCKNVKVRLFEKKNNNNPKQKAKHKKILLKIKHFSKYYINKLFPNVLLSPVWIQRFHVCFFKPSVFSLLFFFFFKLCWLFPMNSAHQWVPCTIHETYKLHFSATFSLKMGPTVLFTHLKWFYYSVFSFQQNKLYPNGPLVSYSSPNSFHDFIFTIRKKNFVRYQVQEDFSPKKKQKKVWLFPIRLIHFVANITVSSFGSIIG